LTLLSEPRKVFSSLSSFIQGRINNTANYHARNNLGSEKKVILWPNLQPSSYHRKNLCNKGLNIIHKFPYTVWKIRKQDGIPHAICELIQCFYRGSRYTLEVEGNIGEWFDIITDVKQGCALSLLVFLMVMGLDSQTKHCNYLNMPPMDRDSQLGDLDFADDTYTHRFLRRHEENYFRTKQSGSGSSSG